MSMKRKASKMTSEYTYTIDEIGVDGFDLYVSDDDGYTWEYYDSYGTYQDAVFAGNEAVANAYEGAMKNDE